MKFLIGIVTGLFLVFTLMFAWAESRGLIEPGYVQGLFESVRQNPGGLVLVALLVAGLLAADLFLPVPSSVVMTLAGLFLGTAIGAMVSFAGAMASALIGFGLCRRFGQKAFTRMIGDKDTARIARLLDSYGMWAILLSRSVPMLTEVMSCVAGLGSVPPRRFLAVSAAGTLPICLVYAWAGAASGDPSGVRWAVLLAFVIPAAGFVAVRLFKSRAHE